MPTYQYACTACGHRFDAVQSFTDDALTECPECAGRLRKLFGAVGVVFKGSGFYRTDSRAGNGDGPNEGAKKDAARAEGGGKDSAKSGESSSSGSAGKGDASSSSSTSSKSSGSSTSSSTSTSSGSAGGSTTSSAAAAP
ncbi:MAG TPA: FmdB family zinc ribbon protein [Pseudonocardiaceae bacterium]|nr:FmdB family zinc ribbon protein [Pseudonocardiaceae bacterium]